MAVSTSYVLGILICLIGDVILNLGVNIQKYSHAQNQRLPLEERHHYLTQWRWWLGMIVFLLGNLGELLALSLISPTLTTPLGSVSLVSNVIFAHLLLREAFDRSMLLATIAIIMGAVFITTSSVAGTDQEFSAADLATMLSSLQYIAYICSVAVLIAASYSFVHYQFYIRTSVPHLYDFLQLQPPYSRSQRTREINADTFRLLPPNIKCFTQFCLPTFAGLVGSQTVLFVKATSSLVRYSYSTHSNQFIYPLANICLFLAVASALTQVHFMNVSLRAFNTSYVVPVFYVSWTLSSVIGAGCLFNDFADFAFFNYVAFIAGLMLVFSGVWLLSSSPLRVHDNGHDEDVIGREQNDTHPPISLLNLARQSTLSPSNSLSIATSPSRRRREVDFDAADPDSLVPLKNCVESDAEP